MHIRVQSAMRSLHANGNVYSYSVSNEKSTCKWNDCFTCESSNGSDRAFLRCSLEASLFGALASIRVPAPLRIAGVIQFVRFSPSEAVTSCSGNFISSVSL
jgi:hypothetical protein